MEKLYGIGVEPGDLELFALRAHRIFNAADVIFCPEEETRAGSFALDVIQGLLEDTKAETVNLVYPMHYHGTQLRKIWKQNAGCITQCLNGDRTGAFITPGNPAIYNTFMYTLPYTEEAGVEAEVAPGVIPFCAVADSMKIPLVVWSGDLVVAPMHKNSSEDLGGVFRERDNVVLMKPSTSPQALLKALRENHLEGRFVLITKTGTEEERLVTNLEELERYDIPYLSTVTIKKQGGQQ